MCYNQTKFVKNELYMERFHGNGLKNLNSAVILTITPPKKKFGAREWHKESFLKIWAQSDQKSIFKIKQSLGKKFLNAPKVSLLFIFPCLGYLWNSWTFCSTSEEVYSAGAWYTCNINTHTHTHTHTHTRARARRGTLSAVQYKHCACLLPEIHACWCGFFVVIAVTKARDWLWSCRNHALKNNSSARSPW